MQDVGGRLFSRMQRCFDNAITCIVWPCICMGRLAPDQLWTVDHHIPSHAINGHCVLEDRLRW